MVFNNLSFLQKKEMLATSRLSTQIFSTLFKLITVLLLLKMVGSRAEHCAELVR